MNCNVICKLLFVTMLAIASFISHVSYAGQQQVQAIYFESIPLGENDRISVIEADLSCAHFSDFKAIPEDWSVQLTRPISGVEKLKMEAGHGSSQLPKITELNNVIGITKDKEPGCFQLIMKATVIVDVEAKRSINLKTSLKPWTTK